MMDLGKAGEKLVAAWISQQGWRVLHQRWRGRQGEIDLIVHIPESQTLAFVEVKTRRGGNWDQGGLMAVDFRKQQKLWQTANYFLGHHPQWAERPCRFDVAVVFCYGEADPLPHPLPDRLQLGQRVNWLGYSLCLQQYLVSAFEG
ncbi:MAG: YraN family protein [Synechocystis sp.]|nr:YraN family protein [Synechocystis sp.]